MQTASPIYAPSAAEAEPVRHESVTPPATRHDATATSLEVTTAQPLKRLTTGVATAIECLDCDFMKRFKAWAVSKDGVRIINTAMIVISFVSIALSAYSYYQIKQASTALTALSDAWNSAPIADVQFVSASATCPTGTYSWSQNYHTANKNPGAALLDPSVPTFPGASAGCSCNSGASITVGATCSAQQSGCISTSAIASKTLSSFLGVQACISLYTDSSMSSLQRARGSYIGSGTGSAKCPTGWLTCSATGVPGSSAIGGLINNTEVTCTKTGLTCPVTSVLIAAAPLASANWTCTAVNGVTPAAYGCVQRSSINAPGSSNNPLVAIGVSQGPTCLSPGVAARRASNDIRSGQQQQGCGDTNTNIVVTATLTPAAEYASNGVMSTSVASAFFSWAATNTYDQFNLVLRPEDNWLLACPTSRVAMGELASQNLRLQIILLALLVINAVSDSVRLALALFCFARACFLTFASFEFAVSDRALVCLVLLSQVTDLGCGSYACHFVGIEWKHDTEMLLGQRRFRNVMRAMEVFSIATLLAKFVLAGYVFYLAYQSYFAFSTISTFSPGIAGYTTGCTGLATLGAGLDLGVLSLANYLDNVVISNFLNTAWFLFNVVLKFLSLRAYSHAVTDDVRTGEEVTCCGQKFVCWE